jgi:mono/diheme cytochrome c family protein/DNA-binding beta-propeller fold protein YncE
MKNSGVYEKGKLVQRAAMCAALAAAVVSGCGADPGSSEVDPEPIAPAASRPPPAISGGTLLVTADGSTAVAADPDRDRVFLADVASMSLLADIALEPLDEPGRVVEGPPGKVTVALRRAGAVATIDIASRQVVRRTSVCPAPRGVAYDSAASSIHVACAGGELVTLAADSGAEIRRLRLQSDLRDVVVEGDRLFVSLFRSAHVLVLDADGQQVEQRWLANDQFFGFQSAVAWRMVPLAGGGAAVVHQRGAVDVVNTSPGGYGQSTGCGEGIVHSTVSFVDAAPFAQAQPGASIRLSALPVDMAISPDGLTFAVVAAGSDTVLEMPVQAYRLSESNFNCEGNTATPVEEGQPTAVAFAGTQRLIQTREPARLVRADGAVLELPGESVFDVGHMLFHKTPNEKVGMSCASCHPEGRDDGRVWFFSDVGVRRTQSVLGGILATAPLHWDGSLNSFDPLMSEVFTNRMGGEEQSPRRMLAAALWIDSLPALPASPPANASAADRGKALFEDPKVGCATCHSGPRLTNNATVDVGTGGEFQVPSLTNISARAPFMHNGCAPTLRDRFSPGCGGEDAHGVTSHLTQADISDLVTYLETL